MDYNKENVDELFQIGNKILSELQNVSQKKSDDLKNANRRFENLQKKLQEVLNDSNVQEGNILDINFNESKAFEDLHGILNNIYAAANFYYTEMKTAQNLNREKDNTIADLKNSYEKILVEKDNKISELVKKLDEQTENFKTSLKDYGDYNMKLTEQLKNFQETLNAKKNKLDEREEKLNNDRTQLDDDCKNFEDERRNFDEEKNSLHEKAGRYDALKNVANNFDEEKKILRDEYEEKIRELTQLKEEYEKKIQDLEKERDDWKEKAENYKKQLNNTEAENDSANVGTTFNGY